MIRHLAGLLRALTTGIIVTIAMALTSACTHAAEDIAIPDQLTVVIHDDFPPFAYIDKDGVRKGFDVELAGALCKNLGVACHFEFKRFDEIVSSIASGHPADLYIAGLWEIPERTQTLAFTQPYYRSRHVFISNDPSITDIRPENASRLKIGTLAGTPYLTALQHDLEPYGADIIAYPTQSVIFDALEQNKINVVLVDGLSGYFFLMKPENTKFYIVKPYKRVPEYLTSSKIAVRRDLAHLIPVIDDFLLYFVAIGEYQELSLKYFPFMIY